VPLTGFYVISGIPWITTKAEVNYCKQAIALIDLGNEGFECNRDLSTVTPNNDLGDLQLTGGGWFTRQFSESAPKAPAHLGRKSQARCILIPQ
jgi:hypothetical protein